MDYNTINSNAFTFTITRLPETMFRVVQVNLPSINVVPAPAPHPMLAQEFQPGSATDFEELQMTFIVDENLFNYEELYNWITQQRYGEYYAPKNTNEKSLVSDGSLVTMTNASNPNRVFRFKNIFPIDLGSLQFDTRDSTPEPLTCQVTFKYSYFTLQPKI